MKAHLEGCAGAALISGASGGIGSAIARRLARQGRPVVLFGRDARKLDALAAEITASAGSVAYPRTCDLTNAASIDEAIRDVRSRFDAVDVLVNAAGDGPVASLLEASDESWSRTIQVKLLGTILLTRVVAESMSQKGSGRIVVVNGIFAQQPHPLFIVNATVNSALRGFAKALSMDLGARGITVNTVNPGITEGVLWAQIARDLAEKLSVSPVALEEQLRDEIPLRRFATGDDIAEAVAFLTSPAAAYINGAVLNVDGGACAAA